MSSYLRTLSRAFALVLVLVAIAGCDSAEPGHGPTDTTPPAVQISAPAAGAVLSGTVSVNYAASDEGGVARVDLLVDGNQVATSTTASGTMSFDSKVHADGPHSISVRATDRAGNVGTSMPLSVTFRNVDTNPPSVQILTPAAGSVLAGTVNVGYSASDASGITRVDLLLNGNQVGTSSAAAGTIAFDSTPYSDGLYTLSLRAIDGAGNIGLSAPISVALQNDAQSVRVTHIALVSAPFVRPDGTGWDFGSGPDFFVELRTRQDVRVAWTSVLQDATPSSLPVTWTFNQPVQLNMGGEYRAVIWDEDLTTNELVGVTGFYAPANDRRTRPPMVTLTGGGITVRLHLQWQ
jgi:hypothetical protein